MKTWHKIALGVAIGFVIYNEIQKNKKTIPVYYRKKIAGNYNARTIPPFGIFIKEEERNNQELLNHELIHWEQYKGKGLLRFYADYLYQNIKYGYDKMPMEKEARINESDFCKENYVFCVQNGLAKTVYNKNFKV